jgi:hypothetical protein
MKITSFEPIWVKKRVSSRRWNDFYSGDNAYTFLGESMDGGVNIGFLVVKNDNNLELCDREELITIDKHNRHSKHFPCPFGNEMQEIDYNRVENF